MKKPFRVCKNYEFSSIIGQKKSVASNSFVCYYQKRKEELARFGICLVKKLGNAVCLNKEKRQVRSMVDHLFNFKEEYDLIIIVRPRYHLQDFAQNEKELATNKIRIEKKMKR